MNIEQITDTIQELEENAPTTFQNCINLAALYIVRDHAQNAKSEENSPQETTFRDVRSELSDILPAYLSYIETKKKYQQNSMISDRDSITYAMANLCEEIEDFIDVLYTTTETPESRTILKETLARLHNRYKN